MLLMAVSLASTAASAQRDARQHLWKAEAAQCPRLIVYDPALAERDAAGAVKAGRRYLFGVYGFSVEVPGRTRTDLPVRMIEGTSDFECDALNRRTRDYAGRFNLAIQRRSTSKVQGR
jgi:hypothetical protein